MVELEDSAIRRKMTSIRYIHFVVGIRDFALRGIRRKMLAGYPKKRPQKRKLPRNIVYSD